MLVSIQRFIILYSYSANEHFLHAYYMSGMDLDPEGNAKNREGEKKADIPDLTEPAYPYEGGKYYEEKQSREEGEVKI